MHQYKSSFCLLRGNRPPVLPPICFSPQRSLVPSFLLRMLHTRVEERDMFASFNSIWKQVMCSPQGLPLDSWDIEDVYYFVEANFSVEVAVTCKFKGTVQGFMFTFWRAILFSRHFVVSVIVFVNLIHKMVLSNLFLFFYDLRPFACDMCDMMTANWIACPQWKSLILFYSRRHRWPQLYSTS